MPTTVIAINGQRILKWLAIFCFANFTLFALHAALEVSSRSDSLWLSPPLLGMALAVLFAIVFGATAGHSHLRNGFLLLVLIFVCNPYIFSAHTLSVLGFLISFTSLIIGITCAQQARTSDGFDFNSFIHGVALLALLGVVARYAPLLSSYAMIDTWYQVWQHTLAMLALALGLLLLIHEIWQITPLLRPTFTLVVTFLLAITLPLLLIFYWQHDYFINLEPLRTVIEGGIIFIGTFVFGMLLAHLPHLRWDGTVDVVAVPRGK